jgi:hypothetical protein
MSLRAKRIIASLLGAAFIGTPVAANLGCTATQQNCNPGSVHCWN